MLGNSSKRVLCLVIVLVLSLFLPASAFAQSLIFNGSLNLGPPQWPRPDAAAVESLRANGWTCPDSDDWPAWWQPRGSNVTFEAFPSGGKLSPYCSISGKEGFIVCPSYPLKQWIEWVKQEKDKEKYGEDYLFTIWVKGRGTLKVSFEAFGKSEDGKTVPVASPAPFAIKVASRYWMRYSNVIPHSADVVTLQPAVSAPEGAVDFDELALWPAEPARALLVKEKESLYGTGALVEDMDMVAVDETFAQVAADFALAAEEFRTKKGAIDANVFNSMENLVRALSPYALTEGLSNVRVTDYNDIIACVRALKRLAGKDPGEPEVITSSVVQEKRLFYKPGVREPRPGRVTITDVRSNKVRYDENEMARTTVTVVSKWSNGTHPPEARGQLIARMIVDLDSVREVARTDFTITIPSRHIRIEEKEWEFTYNVGPETYGRALEVEFVDKSGNTIDKWLEYYAVAAEYFRVQQHCYDNFVNRNYKVDFWTTYLNQYHYFASEPTGLGIQVSDVEAYYNPQTGYRMNWLSRRPAMNKAKSAGVAITFYQMAFDGQMGHEEMRKHPEYVLYDENGQFAVDPFYGGYPSPMELASPIEIGPKRENLKIKPYLDRECTPWPHAPANFALEEALVYAAQCIREYSKAHGFDGIYWDGNVGVWKGYGYDGVLNVPSDKPEDYIRLNARNHRIYSEILKKDDPNFGTWYNWGKSGSALYIGKGHTFYYGSGSGVSGDVSDDAIRTALDFKNVMILDEAMGFFKPGDSLIRYPDKLLDSLLKQRDFVVQKYEGNTIIGYFGPPLKTEEPGLSKWGWPGINYLMAQLIATQHHLAGSFFPSMRPTIQFLTRYSRFIWAPDVKAVPVDEVEKIINLETPERIWWKRLVYKRKVSDGDDLILHLVRIPPTEKWDINWVDEPVPLEGVKITADMGPSTLQTAQACRPYYFEEPQQVVQKQLTAGADTGKVTVEIPPFRYHTMLVFRVKNR